MTCVSRRLGLGRRRARLGGSRAASYAPPFDSASLVLEDEILANFGEVSQWNDESPNAYAFPASPVVLDSSINGRRAPELTQPLGGFIAATAATDDILGNGFDVFAVWQGSGGDVGDGTFYGSALIIGSSQGWSGLALSGVNGVIGGFNDGANDWQIADAFNAFDNTPHVARFTYEPGTTTLSLRVDDRAAPAPVVTGAGPRAQPEVPQIGPAWSGVADWDGKVQIFAWPTVRTVDEAAAFYAWLAARYGVTVP